MPFRRNETKKELELPTFIDVIFLLLIFFLLTYSPVPPQKGEAGLQLGLPVAEGLTKVQLSEKLETLLIEINPVNAKKPELGYSVAVLLPFEDYDVVRLRPMAITLGKAREFARKYGRVQILPPDYVTVNDEEFNKLPAVRLIDDQLDRYVQTKFRVPKPTNHIEIRADKSIKFRIINHILNKCSSYEDLIPAIVFRTMYEKE